MPELPEVEVLRRSLEPRLPGQIFERVEVSFPRLREPIPTRELERRLLGRRVKRLRRRAKYLLVDVEGARVEGTSVERGNAGEGSVEGEGVCDLAEQDSTLVIHLGMSGRLTLVERDTPSEPHEHVNFHFQSGQRLRFRDPRRFGLVFAVASEDLERDRHFAHLGVEPLMDAFDGAYLRRMARGCRGPVKTFLMDARRVVGVGNIYACEALHRAGIHPNRSVARISAARFDLLAEKVKDVLSEAITEGGTTLNDFANADGQEGYFQVSLGVYGREGEPCPECGATIRRSIHSNRSTFYCAHCQR